MVAATLDGPQFGGMRDREQELLVRVLRRESFDSDRDIPGNIDWDRMRRSAGPGLAPYLIGCLERAQLWNRVPGDVRDRLTAVRRANGMAHLLRLRALRGALAALDAAAIPVVVLKGMALAHLVYPDPTLRPMQDVDLWTPPDQLERTAETLRQAGFEFPRRTYEGRWTPGAAGGDEDRALEVPGTPILFELHGALPSWAELPPAFAAAAWARATTAPLGDVTARVLAPEDLLLHVALHLSRRHLFRSGLLGVVDLGLLIERWRDAWRWTAQVDEYRRLGVAQWMRLSFRVAKLLLDAPIPTEVFRRLPETRESADIERLALEQIWNAGTGLPHALEQVVAGERRFAWVRNRLLRYLSGQPWQAGRRLWFDAVTKLPRYARLVLRGELRGGRLRDHLRLVRERSRLASMVDAAERAPETRDR
jgi:hypothetical protein